MMNNRFLKVLNISGGENGRAMMGCNIVDSWMASGKDLNMISKI